MRHLQMENVRLSNEVARLQSRVRFLEEENLLIEQETREECADEIDFLKSEVERLKGAQEVADAATLANMDYKSIIDLIQHRQFNHNSDASRFLKGELDPDDPYLKEMGFEEVIRQIMNDTEDVTSPSHKSKEGTAGKKEKDIRLPKRTERAKKKDNTPKKRNVYTATILKEMGIDTSNLPVDVNYKLIRRKKCLKG